MSNRLTPSVAADPPIQNVALGMHGGTGIAKRDMTRELDKQLRAELHAALAAGFAQLQKPGGTGLDAVETSIRVLEDSPHFNAGKGSVFTHDGRIELDAAIMEGRDRRAGAVAGVSVVKNPISAARAVMEKSKHVLLMGHGAELFATQAGLEIVKPDYFKTPEPWQQIQEIWRREADETHGQQRRPAAAAQQWSTVGAVALDRSGDLAAGTSTGGMANKMFGRVGDSPIIGAGTYADNGACAVSATGHGEYFIRFTVAHEIVALMKYQGFSVADAAAEVVLGQLRAAGGEGGLVALDARGNLAMPYNTESMYRGYVTRDGKITVLLFDD